MKGKIHLIKVSNEKVVPALCLEEAADNSFLFAQIRKANKEDIFNEQDREKMEKYNKGMCERNQMKIRKKYEIDTIYIDQPNGLDSKSVVMIKKLYQVKSKDVLKEISQVPQIMVKKCIELIKQVEEVRQLQKEMQTLKRKIQLAQINNEKYTQYEIRIDQILKELGYPKIKKGKKKPFQNYREVPNRGYIKVYRGGR
jgi:hypothetical protein